MSRTITKNQVAVSQKKRMIRMICMILFVYLHDLHDLHDILIKKQPFFSLYHADHADHAKKYIYLKKKIWGEHRQKKRMICMICMI
jgi:hypothetical protein